MDPLPHVIAHGGAKGALAELGIVLLVALLVAATVKIRRRLSAREDGSGVEEARRDGD
jgi:hypothetical protein